MTPLVGTWALALLLASGTWANPIDIDYRYSPEQVGGGVSYRTGADPVVVRYHDAYYLFATLAAGYWRSTDLVSWELVKATGWPVDEPVAPAVVIVDDTLLMTPSAMTPTVMLASTDPARGDWKTFATEMPALPRGTSPGPWDPALFRDDDGKTYFYWGSSNVFPLFGTEITLEGGLPRFVGAPQPVVRLDAANHGWQRFGRDHADPVTKSFLEGAWMTRHGERYYLQYGAPGTEYNVYATGVAVGTSPLGPFAEADYSPVAYKPGGFVTGAGHGSTFEDAHGNVWTTGTAWVGLNWPFERRIAMFPAGFHHDGQMWVDTRFGDFPHRVPDHRLEDGESTFTGWMLLSYRKKATASSSHRDHPPSATADEDPRTFWAAARNATGETLTIDLGGQRKVSAVQVAFADFESGRFGDAPDVVTRFRLEGSADGRRWTTLVDLAQSAIDHADAYLELAVPQRLRFVRYVHGSVGAKNLAISDLRVFGSADGEPPRAPALVSATRDSDARNAVVTWKPVKGAVGYNVRWGLTAERLHSTYQRFADQGTTLTLRALSRGVRYLVAVEAFDEHGVSALSETAVLGY